MGEVVFCFMRSIIGYGLMQRIGMELCQKITLIVVIFVFCTFDGRIA